MVPWTLLHIYVLVHKLKIFSPKKLPRKCSWSFPDFTGDTVPGDAVICYFTRATIAYKFPNTDTAMDVAYSPCFWAQSMMDVTPAV